MNDAEPQKLNIITSINSKILATQEIGNVENTLDYIFDTINDLIIKKQFDLIDSLLEIIEVENLTIDTIVGILTITSNWKNKLTTRNSFYQRAYKFVNEFLPEESFQIFDGLE